MQLKVCAACKQEKPVTSFTKRSDRIDQYHAYCHPCQYAYVRKRRAENASYRQRCQTASRTVQTRRRQDPLTLAHDRALARARCQKWAKKNRATVNANTRAYRARQIGAAGRHTAADVSKILSAQNHRCFYCGTDITEHPSVDHYIPLARGGSNWPSNLVGACADCNARKGMMLPEDFIQQHKEA